MKTYKEYYDEYEKSTESRDLAFDEWLMLLLAKQEKLMIDKAREWFGQYLMEIGYPDDWLRDSPNMMSGEQRFLKAIMEE